MRRTKREDIPDDVSPGDVLYELRQFVDEFREWRNEVNGDLGFLSRFRSAINDTIRGTIIIIPVAAFVLALLVAIRAI